MATLFDSASLVMIPSGYKDDKLYSIKPTDGSGDFTFSRDGSGASPATRVNASGLIEKGRENVLLQSNSFDTTWSNVLSGSITGGQSGYDGSNDAWELSKGATAYRYIVQNISQSGVNTFSIYAKAGTLNQVTIFNDTGATNPYAKFSLVDGSLVASAGIIDSNATDVGGGWWRFSMTFNATITTARIYPDFAETTAGTIYIQDAQLEQGLISTSYIETTTAPVSAGLLGDMPRLDYSGGATCPSLLLEPSRSNYATQSEYIGVWSQNDVTGTDNFATSPEGVKNAAKISASLTSSTHFIQLIGGAVGDDAVISVFAKADTGSYIQLTNPYSGAIFANFDVATGVVGTKGSGCISSDIEDYGNGWYRCTAVFDNTGFTSTTYRHYIVSSASAGFGQSWLPASDTSLFIYGHQWESGSYPTSYIPTYGSASTRGNETAITSASTLGGLSIGTFFIEMTRQGIDTGVTGSAISLRDNAGAEELRLHFDAPTSQVRWRDGNNGFAQIGGALAVTAGTTFKILIKSDGTTAKVFGNGAQVGSDYSIVSAFDLQRIYNYQLGYEIKQQLFFPTALTDAECIALTTL